MLQIAAENSHIPPEHIFKEWIDKLKQDIDIKEEEITIRVVNTDESQALNKRYRGQDKPTNVLSFPSQLPALVGESYLGDIVICAKIVEKEALAQNRDIEAQWAHMLVHGILHLHGYDHSEDADAQKMEALEVKLLAKLGYANPYEH